MKKISLIAVLFGLLILSVFATPVFAPIVVTPAWPQISPTGIFTATINPVQPINNVMVLLVMSDTSYDGWTVGSLTVAWTGENGGTASSHSFIKSDFTEETVNSIKIPETGGTGGTFGSWYFAGGADGGYTVAEARSHLGISESESVWWAAYITSMKLNTDPVTITINLPSVSPNMIAYLAGSTATAATNALDVRIPPTNGMYTTPEVPIGIAAVAACFGAFILLRRKNLLSSKK